MKTNGRLLAHALAAALLSAPALGQTVCKPAPQNETFTSTLALSQQFVETYKNRALIETDLRVDRYPPKGPHPVGRSGEDGDIHIAGRDTVVKLPFVAEIMNPRYFLTLDGEESRNFMDVLKGTSPERPVPLVGAWRLWFEHPGKEQVMGARVPIPKDTSPPHVFEVHPVTRFGDIDTLPSLIEIKNYKKDFTGQLKSYDAHRGAVTVPYYECLRSSVTAKDMTGGRAGIMIASKKAQYNYTELIIELAAKPKQVNDCIMVLAHVYDSFERGHRLTNKLRRMIFVKDSPPALGLEEYAKGDMLRVLGIPRINLNEVAAVARKSGGESEFLNLPYEIIVAAVLESEE